MCGMERRGWNFSQVKLAPEFYCFFLPMKFLLLQPNRGLCTIRYVSCLRERMNDHEPRPGGWSHKASLRSALKDDNEF